MKKIIAMSMSLIMMAGLVTGCSGEPGKKETMKHLETLCGGEDVEVEDHLVRSLDRDLEFSYWYEWEGTAIWPDIEIHLGGKYYFRSSYGTSLHNYWNDEYRACIEKYDFADVDYGKDGKDEDLCSPNLVYIFIEDEASPEDIAKVESLFLDLREICRDEEEFHDYDWTEGYYYLVYIWYIDPETGESHKTDGIMIKADTKDDKLKLDNIRILDNTYKSDQTTQPLQHGNAKIFVN